MGETDDGGIEHDEYIVDPISSFELAQKMKLSESIVTGPLPAALVLPDNRTTSNPGDALHFHMEAKNVLLALQDANIDAKLYDDGKPKRSIELRHADIVLPAIIFTGAGAVLTGALRALGGWIFKNWVEGKEKKKAEPTIQVEYAVMKDGAVQRWTKMKGPASKIAKILRDANGNDGNNSPRKRLGKT